MRRNTKIAGIALALLGAAFLLLSGFASCNAGDGYDEKEAEIESVAISADAECIGAEGSTTLTAKPSFSKRVDSPSVSYSWENTGGVLYRIQHLTLRLSLEKTNLAKT